jgi:hypothetical protein
MDLAIEQFADFDMFFYYGSGKLENETKSDIFQNLMQQKRSLFYDRYYDSAGIKQYENRPNSFDLRINMPYDIVTSISKRNTVVSAGENDRPDRRIALSQSTIRIENSKKNLKVSVLYIPLATFKQTDQISVLLPTNI